MARGEGAKKGRAGGTTTAEKLETMFERFRRLDGERWKKREIERATGEKVSASYVSAICRGKIKTPGEEMKELIARTMGFPKSLWDLEPEWWDREIERAGTEAPGTGARGAADPPLPPPDEQLPALRGDDLALLVNRLFEHMPNRPAGRPYTDSEVAALSAGAVSEEELAGMRSGRGGPVGEAKLLALCDVFDVSPDYWRSPPDERVRLEGVAAIERFLAAEYGVGGAHRGASEPDLSEKDRDMLRTIIDTLGRSVTGRRRGGRSGDGGGVERPPTRGPQDG